MSENAASKAVTIHILDKEYLDKKMREIRDSGKVVGADRVAVMAALNIAHELLSGKGHHSARDQQLDSRIKGLQAKIESALTRTRQLEF